MARKRMKGCKYRRVSQQQKYIFLKLCVTEQQSIHEVINQLRRQPIMQAFITLLPKQYFSFTKKTTKITLLTMFKILKRFLKNQTRSRHLGKSLQLISMVTRLRNKAFRSLLTRNLRWRKAVSRNITRIAGNKWCLVMMMKIQ